MDIKTQAGTHRCTDVKMYRRKDVQTYAYRHIWTDRQTDNIHVFKSVDIQLPATRWTWTSLGRDLPPPVCPCGIAGGCCSALSPSSSVSSSPEMLLSRVRDLLVLRVLPVPGDDRERKKKAFFEMFRFIGLECRQSLTTSSPRCQQTDTCRPWSSLCKAAPRQVKKGGWGRLAEWARGKSLLIGLIGVRSLEPSGPVIV
jgi:hypothetical protein